MPKAHPPHEVFRRRARMGLLVLGAQLLFGTTALAEEKEPLAVIELGGGMVGNGRFLCRRCWRLGYRSQLETPLGRTTSRMQKIRTRLGGSANLLEPFPLRPRYMHHRRYQKLRACYLALSEQNTADLVGFLFRLKRRSGIPT